MQSYYIIYNGSTPFKVDINTNNKKIDIYKMYAYYGNYFLYSYCYEQIFIGKDNEGFDSSYDGNSILIKISKYRYLWIGENICEYFIEDEITEFHSPVISSDTAYPYALSENNIYLMISNTFYDKNILNNLSSEIKKEAEHWFNLEYGVYYCNKIDKSKFKKIECIILDNGFC